ncbi:MAG TPA: GntR family transcriptional regulator [Alphaproteobacteria bacterium]|nr:GntR family transcriptional regulator [Alphaproteobacteria bacterium]
MMAKRPTTGSSRLPESDRFLYRSVSRKLRHLVDAGTYGPGARLPSAGALAKEFGVSTITIRRAIRDLSLEGHLVGRQGLGVFVASKRRITRLLRADCIAPIEDDMRNAGLRPGIQELHLTLAHAGDDGAFQPGKLSLGIGYRLERILLADDEPVALDTIWLPQKLGDVLKPKLHGHFVMSLIQAHNIAFDHIDYQFEGSTATDEQAALLNVMTGFPVLAIRYAPIGKGGVPLLLGRTISRADRFVYEFCARPSAHRAKRSRQ